jgi:hypothetical protein
MDRAAAPLGRGLHPEFHDPVRPGEFAVRLSTFGVLLWVYQASAETSRTAWFVESLLTMAVALVVRTRLPFYRQLWLACCCTLRSRWRR